MIAEKRVLKRGGFNILIRTSNRPNYFRDCVESIKKHHSDAIINVISDEPKDRWYIDRFCPDCNYFLVDKKKAEEAARKISIGRRFFISNFYFNIIREHIEGWCLIVDDDNEMISSVETPKDTNKIYIYRVNVGVKTVPTQSQRIIFKDIDSGCIIFHSKRMVDWLPQKGGDYLFIREMASKNKKVWFKKTIISVQDKQNMGNRKDKA